MSVPQSILDRLVALLKMTEANGCSVNEAANAAKLAQSLMEKYRLSQAELMTAEEGATEEPIVSNPQNFLYSSQRRSAWREWLGVEVCELNYCRMILHSWYNAGKKEVRFQVIGRPSDIQITTYFFQYLTREIERLAEETKKAGEIRGKSQMHAFKMGAVQTVILRMREARQEARQEATTQAIVKVDSREAEVDAWLQTHYPKLGKATTHKVALDLNAFEAGKEAGKSIALNKGLEGKNIPALGS